MRHLPPTPASTRRGPTRPRLLSIAVLLAVAAALVLTQPPSGPDGARAAEVFADGFESGNLSSWTSSSGLAVQTQQVFAGTYAARNTSSAAWAFRNLADPLTEVSFGYRGTFVSRSTAVILLRLRPASGPWILQLLVNKAGKLAYRNNVAKVTRVSGEVLATGRWYAFEVRTTIAGSSSTVEVLLDGVPVTGLTQTENLGTAPIGKLEIGNRPTNRVYDLAIDEVVASSESGGGGGGGGGGGCPTSWSTVPAPNSIRALTGVTAVADDDAWAVGFTKGRQATPATARWNGSSWSAVSAPGVGDFRSAFNAVDAVSTSNVWAVGYLWSSGSETSGKAYRTVTQRWNGSSWSVVSSPNQGTGSNDLVDVDARTATDVWAVGYWMDGNVKKTLAMRWNGSSWQIVSTPSPGTASNALTAVAAVSADEAYAVGYRGDGRSYDPLILRWNGTGWVTQNTAALDLGDETILTGVAANGPGDVWVVGYVNGPNGYRAMSGRLVSGAWQDVAAHNPGGSLVVPRDVAVGSDGSLWGAGFRHGNEPNSESTLIQRFAGGSWSTVSSPNLTPDDNALYGISATPGSSRLWAVGRAGIDGMIVTACPDAAGTAATTANSGTTELESTAEGGSVSLATQGSVEDATASVSAAAIPVVAVDKAAEAGLKFTTHTFPPTVFDYDLDGWMDVVLNRHYEDGTALYRNRGNGTFQLVQAFPKLDRHGCDAGDVNGDGLPDLYCTIGANFGTDAKANELWIQQSGGGWVDRAPAYKVLDPFGRGRNAVFLDADRDGDLDLYVGNVRERGDGLPGANRFWLATSTSSFAPAQSFGLDVELRVGCARTADFDRDAYPDLLVCTNAGPKLYRNDGGTRFVDVAPQLAPGLKGSDGIFTDLDGDGRLDIVMVQGSYVRIWLQAATGSFARRASIELPGVKKVAAGDVNEDGLPDIYVLRGATSGSSNAPDIVLLNGGDGSTYSSLTAPGNPGGLADSVEPIDYDRNGQTDFLVMNGDGLRTVAGDTQLIAFFPA